MSTASRRHASGKQEMASGTSFTPIGSVDDVASPETLLKVQEQRQTLIEEKRREVARVMDQHDDLVRAFELYTTDYLPCIGARAVPSIPFQVAGLLQPQGMSGPRSCVVSRLRFLWLS